MKNELVITYSNGLYKAFHRYEEIGICKPKRDFLVFVANTREQAIWRANNFEERSDYTVRDGFRCVPSIE